MSDSRSLRGQNGPASFRRFLQVPDAGADGVLRDVCDGEGDILPLRISTTGVEVTVAPSTPNAIATKAYVDAAVPSISLPLAIADGGTGATTAANARTALGATATGSAAFTAADAAALRTAAGITSTGTLIVTQPNMGQARQQIDCIQRPDTSRWIGVFVPNSSSYTLTSLAAIWAWVVFLYDGGVPVAVTSGVSAGGGAPIITTTATQVAQVLVFRTNT